MRTRVGATEQGRGAREPVGDDRILPATRAVALVVTGILVAATWVLYVRPNQTDRLFAWTIHPTMTAMVMGAGYGSALYFYLRVLSGRRWHTVTLGFLPTTLFTWMLLAATLIHWEKFRHGSLPFRLWFWIYVVTPVLVPAIWALNRRRDPGPRPGERLLPGAVRTAVILAGVVMLGISVVLFAWPDGVIRVWPWTLTPLTCRAISAFVALPGVAWIAVAADRRWAAARTMLETLGIGLVLILLAVARAWSEFDHGNLLTWVYLVGLAGTLAGIVALWTAMEGRRRARTSFAGG